MVRFFGRLAPWQWQWLTLLICPSSACDTRSPNATRDALIANGGPQQIITVLRKMQYASFLTECCAQEKVVRPFLAEKAAPAEKGHLRHVQTLTSHKPSHCPSVLLDIKVTIAICDG